MARKLWNLSIEADIWVSCKLCLEKQGYARACRDDSLCFTLAMGFFQNKGACNLFRRSKHHPIIVFQYTHKSVGRMVFGKENILRAAWHMYAACFFPRKISWKCLKMLFGVRGEASEIKCLQLLAYFSFQTFGIILNTSTSLAERIIKSSFIS